jgi:hypothetical protein
MGEEVFPPRVDRSTVDGSRGRVLEDGTGDRIGRGGVATAVQMSWEEPPICWEPEVCRERLPGVNEAVPQKVGKTPSGNRKRVV